MRLYTWQTAVQLPCGCTHGRL